MKAALSKLRCMYQTVLQSQKDILKMQYGIKHDALIEKALYSTEPGVTDASLCNEEVVVSLTTYGKRLYEVAATIESIMQGSMRPNRIVLWLDDGLKEITLPIVLQKQQARGLIVEYCRDIRSYKKLVPSLKKFPDAAIITVDDDAIYHYDMVEKLVNKHILSPGCIVANRIHRVVLGENNRPVGYMHWKWEQNPADASPLNFSTGVGGTLYPPNSLSQEVVDESTFMDICKHADDVWFYAMALKAGTPVIKCPTHSPKGNEYIMNPDVQDVGLFNINTGGDICQNDIQLKAVFDRYNLWSKLM